MGSQKSNFTFSLLTLVILSTCNRANAVTFNTDFLAGESRHADMSRFYRDSALPPGDYALDVYINEEWKGRFAVAIKEKSAWFQSEDIEKLGVIMPGGVAEDMQSKGIDARILAHGGVTNINSADLSLHMTIPQAYIRQTLRGYVDPASWDEGVPAFFMGYNANYNDSQGKENAANQSSSYLQLNSALNLSGWQLRDKSGYHKTSRNEGKWTNSSRYIERGLAGIHSQLRLGDSYSENDLFDSLRYRGMSLRTDSRMLPDSQQGFSPIVRGVALTNAVVSIRQNNQLVYQRDVPPGPFEISDILPTGSGGDLSVEVKEADGRASQFIVPYSSVPNMLQQGSSKYSILAGEARPEGSRYHPEFIQGGYQYGFNNVITGYAGIIASESYNALMSGAGLNLPFGAVSFDVTQSFTERQGDERLSGQSYKLAFSRFFNQTGTNFSLAAYRYSTRNYYSFNDAIAVHDWDEKAQPERYLRQKNTFNISLSQALGESLGSLYLSGTWRDYWEGDGTNREYQFGYSNHIGSLSYTLAVNSTRNSEQKNEKSYYLTFSLPFSLFDKTAFVSGNTTLNADRQMSNTLGLSGTAGTSNQASYNLSATRDHTDSHSANASLSYRTSFATLNGSFSEASQYRQFGLGASGSLVAWRGGVLTSSQVGDTFAIVEAPGAKGATLAGDESREVNSRGQVLVPYLSPYRKNRVQLETTQMADGVELKGNIKEVVPYAGSVTVLHFDTDRRQQFIVPAEAANGKVLPFGTEVFDGNKVSVGYVAQGGVLYIKADTLPERLVISINNNGPQNCVIDHPVMEGQKNVCYLRSL